MTEPISNGSEFTLLNNASLMVGWSIVDWSAIRKPLVQSSSGVNPSSVHKRWLFKLFINLSSWKVILGRKV